MRKRTFTAQKVLEFTDQEDLDRMYGVGLDLELDGGRVPARGPARVPAREARGPRSTSATVVTKVASATVRLKGK